jgi:hypothetical protein
MVVTAEQIRAAFDGVARPADAMIALRDHWESPDLRDFFSQQSQFDIAAAGLERHSAALSLFYDEAFVYWLPAFMIAELNVPHILPDSLSIRMAWKFIGDDKLADRSHLLSATQAKVVADYFEMQAERFPEDNYGGEFTIAARRLRERSAL